MGAIANITPAPGVVPIAGPSGKLASGWTDEVSLDVIGAIPNANGASLSGQTLALQPANGSFGGVVTAGTQTIAGLKTFSTGLILGTDPGGSDLLRVGGAIKASSATLDASNPYLEWKEAGTQKFYIQWLSGSSSIQFDTGGKYLFASSGATKLAINTDGTVVVGTDPSGSDLLRVGGSTHLGGAVLQRGPSGLTFEMQNSLDADRGLRLSVTSGIGAKIATQSGSYPLILGFDGGSHITITTGGTVLIGTDPGGSELLRCAGGFRFTADSIIASSTDATSTTAAALVISGGIGWGDDKTSYGGGLLLVSPTIGLGYATGAGGEVTQATSKSTGVTLDTVCGKITMHAASLGAVSTVSFTLTNSAIEANDLIIVNIKSGATVNSYDTHVESVSAGSCVISLRNHTAGALAQAVVLSFAVIKAVEA